MQMWLWTLHHLQNATDADGDKLYQRSRQGVTFPLADALCWLLALAAQILDVWNWSGRARESRRRRGLAGHRCSSSPTSATCRRRGRRAKSAASAPSWSSATTATRRGTRRAAPPATSADELDALEAIDPRHRQRRAVTDVIGDGRVASREGRPCVRFEGLEQFSRLRVRSGRLPDRLAAGQGPRRRSADQGDDSRSAGLPGIEWSRR